MNQLSTSPYQSNRGIAKLNLVLFAVFAFSLSMGTAQAEVCPDLGAPYTFQSASLEGNHETGEVVSCHYVSADLSKKDRTIRSSDYIKNYLTVMPDKFVESDSLLWTGDDKLKCGPDRLKCVFFGMNLGETGSSSIFPKDLVPKEYSCDPDRYWEIFQQYDQCESNGSLSSDSPVLTKPISWADFAKPAVKAPVNKNCRVEKTFALASLESYCTMRPLY